MNNLYGWWFTYNSLEGVWCAATEENRHLIKNDYQPPLIIKSKEIILLIDLIIRTNGDIDEMNNICK